MEYEMASAWKGSVAKKIQEKTKNRCFKIGSMNGKVWIGVGGLISMSVLLFIYISTIVSRGIFHNSVQDLIHYPNFQQSQVSKRHWVSKVDQNNAHNFKYRYLTSTGKHKIGQAKETDDNVTISISSHGRSITMHCCACKDSEENSESNVPANLPAPVIESKTPKKLRILIGVLTSASQVEQRNLLRMAYGVQSTQEAEVNVRFVIGEQWSEMDRTMVGMENATYGDIIVLSGEENLNEEKTFTYFSSLPGMGVLYDYVMKTDDDSYIRVDNLAKHVIALPQTDLYNGYIMPCESSDADSSFMATGGYLISWDLVVRIADSAIPKNMTVRAEDRLVADWINAAGVAMNPVNDKRLFYDHPEFGGSCAHDFIPETILIHQLNTPERWADVLKYFENDTISRALDRASSADI